MWELLLNSIIGFGLAVFVSFIYMNGIKLIDFMMKHGHIFHNVRFAIVYYLTDDVNKEYLKSELKRANESHPSDGNDIMEEAFIIAGGKRWVCPLCMGIYLSIFWLFPTFIFLLFINVYVAFVFLVTLYPMIYYNFANE